LAALDLTIEALQQQDGAMEPQQIVFMALRAFAGPPWRLRP
jgi:hypothetical protein